MRTHTNVAGKKAEVKEVERSEADEKHGWRIRKKLALEKVKRTERALSVVVKGPLNVRLRRVLQDCARKTLNESFERT